VSTVEPAGVKVDHVLIADDAGAIFIIVGRRHDRRISNGNGSLLPGTTRGSSLDGKDKVDRVERMY
jgi:hypothetical protein